jgi:peroxiredoxin
MATNFDLPDLSGGRMTLSQWQDRPILLVFVDPRCPFSRELLAVLGTLPEGGVGGRPMPLVLTTGSIEENRRLAAEYGLRCPVLLQEEREVASVYRVDGTPMGYLLVEQRLTASGLAVGAGSLLWLAGLADRAGAERPLGNGVTRWQGGAPNNDRGLAAGMLAPVFRLPRLGGGELSLDAYRGRPVLLVFSDPTCHPCRELAPKLQRVHRRSPDLQVLMISRGDPAANRAQAAAQRLTFPIALQRHWETSRAYRLSAAPVGYLIDERGVIAADVAVGAEAVQRLVDHPLAHANGRPELSTP